MRTYHSIPCGTVQSAHIVRIMTGTQRQMDGILGNKPNVVVVTLMLENTYKNKSYPSDEGTIL